MKHTKKSFNKFSKRNVHKRKAKSQMIENIKGQLDGNGISYNGAKISVSTDSGRRGRVSPKAGREEIRTRGVFSGSKSGFGFVTVEESERDIFIPEDRTMGAIHGDLVEIIYHTYRTRDGETKTEGRVVKIAEVARKTVIGSLSEEITRHGRRMFRRFYLQPDDHRLGVTPYVLDRGPAEVGDKVEAIIRRDGTNEPYCEIIRIFGKDDSREANYAAILAECSIPTEFSEDELNEAEKSAAEELTTDGRADLRRETIFTIDGEGAKDLDDAVSLRRLPGGGWRLGVHIADVSHYVRERTPLDRCAMSRGTSVYFTDKVVPMLPTALSNGACSLNSDEDKYTLSAIIDLDADGNITRCDLKNAIIRSHVRGVYSEVNSLLGGVASSEIKKK